MIEFIKRKEFLFLLLAAVIVTAIFFYKTVFFQQIPFPGDLLVSQSPYKTQSFLGYAPGGYPNIAQGMDVITELFPWKYFTIQQLKAGQIPFWNPHNFAGNIHMQNYQTAIFYPLNIIFFFLSFFRAWSGFIMLQPFLAILWMYIFLRSLSLGRFASLIGGIAFGFSSYMTVWMEYGNIGTAFLWLPLLLFALKKFLERSQLIYFLLAILSLTLSFLAGYIQGVFYIYIISICYCVFLLIQYKKYRTQKAVISCCLIALFPILFTAFQLLPTYELFKQSTRGAYSLTQIQNLLQPVYYWITIFVPDFFGNPAHRNFFLPITYIERVMYIGVPLLFFVFLSVSKVKEKTMKFFLFLAIISLTFTSNLPFIQFLYRIPIPMISTTVPTRALSIFIFCLIVVACFGIDYWLKEKRKNQIQNFTRVIPLLFLGLYLSFWIAVFISARFIPIILQNKSTILHNLIVPTIFAFFTICIFYLRQFLPRLAAILLTLLVVTDLFFFFQKVTPFSPQSLIYPATPVITYLQQHAGINRFWGYGSAYIAPNFQTYDGTYSPEGNDPLHNKDYGILLASSSDGQYPDLLPRPDANIAPGFGVNGIRNPYRQKILDLLGVKYVLSQGDIFPTESYQKIWTDNTWQIYENKQVLPRYFLTSDYVVATNPQDTLKEIYTENLSQKIILNAYPEKSLTNNAKGYVALVKYTPNQIILKTKTTGNMLLFLSDEYYYAWQATIDHVATPVYKADMAFRAVEVPQGKHTIVYTYQDGYLLQGLWVACIGIIFCFFYCLYYYQYVEKK